MTIPQCGFFSGAKVNSADKGDPKPLQYYLHINKILEMLNGNSGRAYYKPYQIEKIIQKEKSKYPNLSDTEAAKIVRVKIETTKTIAKY